MTVRACPADDVDASVERVWSLLAHPEGLDAWWDARILTATPPGPLAPGQRLVARARGPLPLRVAIDVVAVDPARHRVALRVASPLGIIDHATVSCTPLDPGRCRVQFG